ncbi:MAG: ribosome maturation factor RimP [Gammaproteobacteria bacterium]
MILKDKLLGLLEPEINALGYELVELDAPAPTGARVLRLYIDHDDGIGLDDCERVSHAVSGLLDVEDPIQGQYNLEVSSPGLDRPLRTAEHFHRQAGHLVKVVLKPGRPGRRRYKGRIRALDDGVLELETDGGPVSLPLQEIETARLVPEF